MTNTLVTIQELESLRQRALQDQKLLAVLFADLCGSTRFKIERGPIEGLRKAYVHNSTAAEKITDNDGVVVKFIGDEVMGTFEGDGAAARALKTACEIQTAFVQLNHMQDLEDIDKIFTKIGIHVGPVHIFRFEGHDAGDPQGLTVDLTARVVGLAKPEQILCTKGIADEFHSFPTSGFTIDFDTAESRELKGIRGKTEVMEVFWDQTSRGIIEVAHQSIKTDMVSSLLDKARKGQINGNSDQAIQNLEMVLQSDSENFIANVLLTELYYRERGDYKKALEHARRAKASNPYSCVAKQRAATLPWHVEKESDDNALDGMIAQVEDALSIAVDELNSYIEATSRNALAYFYAERYGKHKRADDFNEAMDHCRALEYRYNKLHKHDYAAFLDTYAFVLSQSDEKENLTQALEYASEAEKALPNFEYPVDTKAGIIRKMRRLRFFENG